MDRFLGLMTVLPQQHEADLLLQVRGDETVRDLPFHNVIWNGEIAATFMAACFVAKADMKGRQGAVCDIQGDSRGSDPSN